MFAFNSLFASQNQLYSRRSLSTLSLAFSSIAGTTTLTVRYPNLRDSRR
jgi:hypothetical protein